MQDTRRVVVFGSSRCAEDSDAYRRALDCGRILGERGLVVVSGGYEGSMGAVSRGAREAGGRVIGITTRIFAERRPNRWVDELHEEIDYPTRMARLLRSGDAYLALPGALGTLSEWVSAWCLASIEQLGGPLWAFRDPWEGLHQRILEIPELAPELGALVAWLDRPEDLHARLDHWLEPA